MRHEGRGVIRLGDKTDHGGHVISASSGTIVMGKQAALADDMTYCPACKGQFAIKSDGQGAKHAGRFYSYHGDPTDCGARLISSMVPDNSTSKVTGTSEGLRAQESSPAHLFDDRFVLVNDETGQPAAFTEYAVQRENGNIEHGVTNDRGETHLLSATATPEKIRIYAAIDD